MKNRPNFSREIGKALTEHSSGIPDRIAEIPESVVTTSPESKQEPDNKPDSVHEEQTEKRAGRPKKPKSERRKQIILTIGPETYDVLSDIPDFRRKLSHYLDGNLDEIRQILEDYVIK